MLSFLYVPKPYIKKEEFNMMHNTNVVEAVSILRLQEYAKLLKNTNFAVFFMCNANGIDIYSTGDCLYSTINHIKIPNNIGVTGIMSFPMTVFNDFCKNLLMPSTPVLISENKMEIVDNPDCNLPFWGNLDRDFLLRLNRLINTINDTTSFNSYLSQEVCDSLKNTLLSMKSTMPSRIIVINDTYFITVFAGMLPLNKADILQIHVIDFDKYYMIEYIIHKKKCQYPISVYHKYMRV